MTERAIRTLKDQLAPLAAKLRETRALIQPVSQIVFRLKPVADKDRLTEAVHHVLRWMDKRAGRQLPDAAWKLESFELADIGAQRVAAVFLREERFWAARLDDADKTVPLRTWITEICIGETPEEDVLFGVRLICSTRGEPQPYARSVPGFVKGVLKAGPAELDGVRVFAEDPPVVSTENDVDDLVNLLERPSRRASVIVFALPDGSIDARETAIDAKEFQGATLGAAHVRVITGPASYHLTDRMGKELSVFRRAVRIYRPGFSRWRDQPTRHPLFLPERIASWVSREAVEFPRWLVDFALAMTLHRGDRETELPAFNTVRQTAARVERDRLRQSGGSSADLARMYEEDNERLRKEVEEIKEEYEGLLDAAESEREQAQQEAQESRARTFALRERIRALEGRLAEADTRPAGVAIPDSLDRFEEWVRQHLSGSVELHNRAYQGVKKSVYEIPALIYESLLLLRDYYVPMRVNGGNAAVNAFEARCRELQIEDALVGEALRTHRGQYTVSYGGKPRLLDRHLKRGGKHDEARCFRLYYFWDDEAQCVVVGWLPSHLDNSRT